MTEEEAEKFFREIGNPPRPSWEGPYTWEDQYRDFSTVFGSEVGKRVFRQIIDKCEGHVPDLTAPASVKDAYLALRKLGFWITATTFKPPRQQSGTKPSVL